jgi:signal transduction histidine kinase
LKHTSPGGVIRISAHVDDDILKVSVFNSGKLMAEDRMQDVFKRYYQLADSQDSDLYGWGTGIGLYYVKRLVELHHGSVRVNRKFMDELYGWMEKRSAEQDLNVATVCRDMLISPAKFNYKIKELTGETPGIFFRKYKLNKAGKITIRSYRSRWHCRKGTGKTHLRDLLQLRGRNCYRERG